MRAKTLRFTLLAISILSLSATAYTQQAAVAYDSETLTIAGTAAGFTASKITATGTTSTKNANAATFTVNCASGTSCILRFTLDASTPTASVGLRALYGDTVSINGRDNVVNFKAIRETGTSVIIDSTYFR